MKAQETKAGERLRKYRVNKGRQQKKRPRVRRQLQTVFRSVADPDPNPDPDPPDPRVFGPPGSGSGPLVRGIDPDPDPSIIMKK
jgi:hypothetical protein